MGRRHKRYKHRRRSSEGSESKPRPRHNPPLFTELAEFIGPGFAAFAATRFLTRIAATQIAKKKPEWAKHAGALASAGSFLAAWYGASRVKALEKYHTPIVVGSAIAGLQTLIQLYVPKLGWAVSDATPQIAEESAAAAALAMPPAAETQSLPPGFQPVDDDPAWYTYNDTYDAGIYSPRTARAGTAQTAPEAGSSSSDIQDDTMADLAMETNDGDTANMAGWGSFQ